MRSSTGITDQFYSNMDDEEKKNKIDSMFTNRVGKEVQSGYYQEFLEFLEWKKLEIKSSFLNDHQSLLIRGKADTIKARRIAISPE